MPQTTPTPNMAENHVSTPKTGENAPRVALESSQIRVLVSALGARLCGAYLRNKDDGSETNIAVKILEARPIARVVANPLIGPDPN